MAELSTSGVWLAVQRLGGLTRVYGGPQDRRQFWETTTRGGRVIIGLAIFALFASLGFLTDVTELGRSSPARVALVTLLSGGGAVAYAVVAFNNIRWMPAVVAVHILLAALLPRWPPRASVRCIC